MAFKFAMNLEDHVKNHTVTLPRSHVLRQFELVKQKLFKVADGEIWSDLNDAVWEGEFTKLWTQYIDLARSVNALKYIDTLKDKDEGDAADYAEKYVTSVPDFRSPVPGESGRINAVALVNKCKRINDFSFYHTNYLEKQGALLRDELALAEASCPEGQDPLDYLDMQLFDSIIEPLLDK